MPALVAPEADGASAGDHDCARAAIESGFQRDHHVANHFDGTGNNFFHQLADGIGHIGAGGAGQSDASVLDQVGADARLLAGFFQRLAQRSARLSRSDARDLTAQRGAATEDFLLVAHNTRGLGAATIEAGEIGHIYAES